MSKDILNIIIVAYNRPYSLERLLESLKQGNYYDDDVRLIISIDGGSGSNNKKVVSISEKFDWDYGEKIIITHDYNLGLKKHIIKCGDLSNQYGNIIMLEDDLFVSRGFYFFAKKSLEFFKEDSKIAGVSLYSQKYNETANKLFEPLSFYSDNYFLQLPSSWGQAWTSQQWNSFKKWYQQNDNINFNSNQIPQNIKKWPNSSWKKYFIKYMVDMDKYFVYPYNSFVTNMGEAGTNNSKKYNTLQVPICLSEPNKFCFTNYNKSKAVYDSFHENIYLKKKLESKYQKTCIVDIYGTKKTDKQSCLLLTTKLLPYRTLDKYSLEMYPHDQNVFLNIKGDGIYLYNLNFRDKGVPKIAKVMNKYSIINYYYFKEPISVKSLIYYLVFEIYFKVLGKN